MITVSKGVRAGVLCVVMVTIAAAFHPPAVPPHSLHHEDGIGDFPCPEDTEIEPCTCTFDGVTFDLTCKNLESEDVLKHVFTAHFPFTLFTSFTLIDSNITTLAPDMFSPIIFQSVRFERNGLKGEQVLEALSSSQTALENFTLIEEVDSEEENSPWPLDGIDKFTKLQKLEVIGPYSAGSLSSTLTSVTLNIEGLTTLPSDAFTVATNLITITLQNSSLESIEANTFKLLTHLETVDLSNCKLQKLTTDSLAFDANLTLVDLSNNIIDTVESGAIKGIQGNTSVKIDNNLLEELPQDPFSTVITELTDEGHVDVNNNPLLCGCDLAWIVTLTDEQRTRLEGLNTSCDIPDDIEFQKLLDFLKYQCGITDPPPPPSFWSMFF
ncbi:oplophorus-luciferin 2-monooxygenase non-catalytic subunit-like [Homarus americanus]|uniref:Oplophorus-luciferin 2-monooxygenase non-catalytic subunit-like 3 n=1 Tax=Homarus americanus TaxID=6706 RepID=A0A8J5MPX1_HOMAM|nr:oplophorus-luciferin 2-monooxygenase non-catalytic subunit-like [Homarus americanus]XP_042239006.1 oplophorus-luciferin 2-monooxygenase non-catalytic subunit-like [Homarus americanus]KAG7159411.1 Oplophorus-luciferin 2-monooxygenase non-catalytic subunit-like 3 [Homarus americanus]